MSNVLGIVWYDDKENNIRRYRCRGVGEKYTKFYREWVPKSSYKCTGSDFPWDYFIFKDSKDHDRLVNDFPGDVFEDKE